MRVLFGVHALPSETYGGTELYTKYLAEELIEQGHEVAVATPCGTDADIDGGTVFDLPEPTTQPADGVAFASSAGVVQPDVGSQFLAHATSFAPDIVHLQHLKNLSSDIPKRCSEHGIPCLLTLHDFWTLCHREQLSQPDGSLCCGPTSVGKCATCYTKGVRSVGQSSDNTRSAHGVADDQLRPVSSVESDGDGINHLGVEMIAMSAVGRRTDHLKNALAATTCLIAPSKTLHNVFIDYGVPPEKIVHRRNGIRIDRFVDDGFDPRTQLRVGYAGRITPSKGVHLLVEAFDAVEAEAELHVFGVFDPESDEYHAALLDRADRERTTFHGGYEQPGEPFTFIDVLVLPAVWYENSPFVIQEAFASSTPVVTTDTGGMAELVTEGVDGLTFPLGNKEALADRLRRLATDPSVIVRLRSGINEPICLSDHAEALVSLYREEKTTAHDSDSIPDR